MTEIMELKVSECVVDPRVQRVLDPRRVRAIAGDFDPDSVGVVTVSRRDNGTYVVVDGQHRLAAMRTLGFEDQEVQAQVYSGLTLAQEAQLFRKLNNTQSVPLMDKFRVSLTEGDPVSVAMMAILDRHDIVLGSAPEHFSAVAVGRRLYGLGSHVFETALVVVRAAWGAGRFAMDGRIIEGVGMVVHRYGEALAIGELVDRLKIFPGGPGALIGQARGLRDVLSVKLAEAMAETIVGVYNRKRSTSALPPWRQ